MFRDGAGRAIISAQAGQSIAKASNVPVYAITDVSIGTGAVGGSLSDIASLGKRAGELADRILGGADPKLLPLEILTAGVPIFDWRALKRWGIGEQRLPPGSVVRFRPETFWDHYKWLIISVLAVCIIEAASDPYIARGKAPTAVGATETRGTVALRTTGFRTVGHFHQPGCR